jgi:folate-binding Fe-S cluster repair protein YgfZ
MTTQELERLKEEFTELKETISHYRKKGNDMFIAWLKIMSIPSKIKMAEATQSDKDILKVQNLIAEAWKEIPQKIYPKESFKKTSSAFEQVSSYLAQAKQALQQGNKTEAKRFYQEISRRFPVLSKEEKKAILADCKKLLTELQ